MAEAEAERAAIEFLGQHVPAGDSPMCGNTICQDRRFLARWMPQLEALLPLPQPRRLHAEGAGAALEARARARLHKEGKHEALADILESIEELKFYRKSDDDHLIPYQVP